MRDRPDAANENVYERLRVFVEGGRRQRWRQRGQRTRLLPAESNNQKQEQKQEVEALVASLPQDSNEEGECRMSITLMILIDDS